MVRCLSVWDQTIGCDNCGEAWWGENATERFCDFHADDCPLKGREDVHDALRFVGLEDNS